jgi:hypothetical protein
VPPSVEMSSSSSFPARTLVAAQHTTKLVGKKLPQSGVEVTLAVMLALGMTGMLRKRPSTSLPSTSLRAGRTGRTK